MKKLRRIKLRTEVALGYGIILAMLVAIVCYYSMFLKDTRASLTGVYENYGVTAGDLGVSYAHYNEIKVAVRNALYIYTPGSTEANQAMEKAMTALSEFGEVYDNFFNELDQEKTDLIQRAKETGEAIGVYLADVKEINTEYGKGNYEGAKQILLTRGIDDALEADAEIEELINVDLAEAAQSETDRIEKRRQIVVLNISIIVAFAVITSALSAYIILRDVTRPVNQLRKAAEKMAKGDIDFELKKTAENELGELMDAFKIMADNIGTQAEVAYTIANGDLSCDVKINSEKDVLGNALNILVNDNNKILSNIKESSMQLTTGADQVASASQALAQGSTEQASAIEEITASMKDIEVKTKDNASKAGEAESLVNDVKISAVGGNEQMQEMIGAMHDINESSENISKIIKVIDDIAFQTNILALNAAVEAARAGVHGKGFAVVAEEVRNLAAKSAAAASETAEMIEDSISKVSVGSKMAEETALALNKVVEEIDRVVVLINQIAVASNEQATAVTQIDQAISQVSQVVQTNSATSEQCAAASEELSNQAAALRAAISKYKLKEQSYQNYVQDAYGMDKGYGADNESIISLGSGFGKY